MDDFLSQGKTDPPRDPGGNGCDGQLSGRCTPWTRTAMRTPITAPITAPASPTLITPISAGRACAVNKKCRSTAQYRRQRSDNLSACRGVGTV